MLGLPDITVYITKKERDLIRGALTHTEVSGWFRSEDKKLVKQLLKRFDWYDEEGIGE